MSPLAHAEVAHCTVAAPNVNPTEASAGHPFVARPRARTSAPGRRRRVARPNLCPRSLPLLQGSGEAQARLRFALGPKSEEQQATGNRRQATGNRRWVSERTESYLAQQRLSQGFSLGFAAGGDVP